MAIVTITNLSSGDEWDNFEAWVKASNEEEHEGVWATGYKITTSTGIDLTMYNMLEDKRTWNFPIEFSSVDDYEVTGDYEGFTLTKYVDKLELVWDGETAPVHFANITLTYNSIPPLIETFELPYPNWYDSEGRIYKDILIKNFNAIEAKINEITSLDIDSITTPDISEVTYPNVDLTTVDDTSIINLKSYLDMVDLINFPLVVKTDGNVKVKRVEYWGSDYSYHTVTEGLAPDTDKPFLYLNYADNELVKSASVSPPTNCVLVAILQDGKLILNENTIPGNVDFLNILTNQDYNVGSWEQYLSGNYRNGGDGNNAKSAVVNTNNQTVFSLTGQKDEAGSSGTYGGNWNTFGLEGKLKEDND